MRQTGFEGATIAELPYTAIPSSPKSAKLAALPITLGGIALAVIVVTTFWLNEQARQNFDSVVKARELSTAAIELRSALQAAESSQRGFLYTHNEIYLAPYDVAQTKARRQFGIMAARLDDYPLLYAARGRLKQVVDAKFAEMDESVALKRQRRDTDALALVQKNRGKALMDEANVFIGGIVRAADQRLLVGVGKQRESTAFLRWVSLFGTAVILVMFGIAARIFQTYTRTLALADQEIRILNSSLEQRVELRTAELARANEEIQKFAHIVTHDLRAPLVNIMGFSAELEGGLSQIQQAVKELDAGQLPAAPTLAELKTSALQDMPEALQFIRTSTKKMDKLINAILRLAREGRRVLVIEPIELTDLISQAAQAIRHQLAADNGTFSLDVGVKRIHSDRFSLEAMIGNILDNASKYRAKDRPLNIEVQVRPDGNERVRIDIRDNGRGILSKDLSRIFEPFRRAGTQDQKGEGIGLAYVRTLAQNLGGEVTVASQPDAGSTFSIIIPRHSRIETYA